MSTQSRAKNRGKANEYQLVEILHARGYTSASRVPLSGALAALPGDVDVPELDVLLEAKVYAVQQDVDGARYMRLDLNWVGKIVEEAKRVGRRWGAVVIRGAKLQTRYVVLPMDDYVELLSCYKRISNVTND